jgi:hypothetical protein
VAYVKLDKDLADDWRVLSLADSLVKEWVAAGLSPVTGVTLIGNASNAVLGGLYCLWRYADTHLRSDDRLNLSLVALSSVTRLPVSLLEKFPTEWLRQNDDGSLTLPDYSSKNAVLNKDERRAQTRERVRRYREKIRADHQHKSTRSSNGRNAITKRKSNAGNAQRFQATGTGTGTTIPGPAESPESLDSTPPRGPLASAMKRLADRDTHEEHDQDRRRSIERNREIAEAAYAATHPGKREKA